MFPSNSIDLASSRFTWATVTLCLLTYTNTCVQVDREREREREKQDAEWQDNEIAMAAGDTSADEEKWLQVCDTQQEEEEDYWSLVNEAASHREREKERESSGSMPLAREMKMEMNVHERKVEAEEREGENISLTSKYIKLNVYTCVKCHRKNIGDISNRDLKSPKCQASSGIKGVKETSVEEKEAQRRSYTEIRIRIEFGRGHLQVKCIEWVEKKERKSGNGEEETRKRKWQRWHFACLFSLSLSPALSSLSPLSLCTLSSDRNLTIDWSAASSWKDVTEKSKNEEEHSKVEGVRWNTWKWKREKKSSFLYFYFFISLSLSLSLSRVWECNLFTFLLLLVSACDWCNTSEKAFAGFCFARRKEHSWSQSESVRIRWSARSRVEMQKYIEITMQRAESERKR